MNKLQSMFDLIEQVNEKAEPFMSSESKKMLSGEKDGIVKKLKEGQSVKVPIVGNFNAGKSALLNAVLGRGEILPENIKAETAIPYELYPTDGEEKVDQYRDGRLHESKPLGEIRKLCTLPGDLAKVYINNQTVHDLAAKGITLVDMPGSDSGIKAHNEAIVNYINNGSVFVFLLDANVGALSKTNIAYLQEVGNYCVSYAIMLSKCDQLPETIGKKEIKECVSLQVDTDLKKKGVVGCISAFSKDIDDFLDYVTRLDADDILFEKFKTDVGAYVDHVVQLLNTYQMAVRYSPENVEKEIEVLEEEKKKIASEPLTVDGQKADTPEKSTLDILEIVKKEISDKAKVIAESVVNHEPEEEINMLIISILRPVFIKALSDEGAQYAKALGTVVDDVSQRLIKTLHIDTGVVDDIVNNYREGIQGIVAMVAEMLKNNPHVYAKVIGYALSLVGDQIPDVIKWVFGKNHNNIVNEAAEKIRTDLYPVIQEKLYPELLKQVKAQQERIRNAMNAKLEERIKQIEATINDIAQKGRLEKESADEEVKKAEEAKQGILELQKTVLGVTGE